MDERLRVIIIGASGGIGKALVKNLLNSSQIDKIYALSRKSETSTSKKLINLEFDLSNEDSIKNVSSKLLATGKFDLCIIATGLLQNKEICNFIKNSSNDICCHGYRWEEHYRLNKIKEKNQIISKKILPISLSYDHRLIDGAEGARFCVYLGKCLGKDFAFKLAV